MDANALSASYLTRLSVANHDGVTQQIENRFSLFQTDNEMLRAAFQNVTQRRQEEDAAYRNYSGKDFVSDDLRREVALMDKYMSAIRGLLRGLLFLPESEPIRRKAELAHRLFKDFDFNTGDGMEASARKTLNMVQQWRAATQYTLQELSIAPWVDKSDQQANVVIQLVAQRVDNESTKVKGLLAEARRQTDAAIRQAYDIINAMMVLQPSDALTQLVNVLLSIEDRAKLYYIAGTSSSNTGGAAGAGGTSQGGTGSAAGTDTGSTGTGDGASGTGSGSTGGTGTGTGSDTGSTGGTGSGTGTGTGGTGGTGSTGSGDNGSSGSSGGSGSGGDNDDAGDGME